MTGGLTYQTRGGPEFYVKKTNGSEGRMGASFIEVGAKLNDYDIEHETNPRGRST